MRLVVTSFRDNDITIMYIVTCIFISDYKIMGGRWKRGREMDDIELMANWFT